MTKHLPQTSLGTRTAEYNRDYWHIVVDPDVSIDDVMRPNFWAHHVASLKPMDLIDVVSVDMTMDLTLRVISKGIGYVEMRPLRVFLDESRSNQVEGQEDESDKSPVPDGYLVNFAPSHRWRVLTNDPREIVSKGHMTEKEAIAAAVEHSQRAHGLAA